jgi:hypothetical protein
MNKSERDLIDLKLKISDDFNREVSKLVKLVDTKIQGNLEVDSLKRLIKLGKSTDPLILINSCQDLLWKFRDLISEEKDQFFLDYDYKDEQNVAIEEDKKFIESIIRLFKAAYKTYSSGEKKLIWKSLKQMLKFIIEFKLACGDHI